MKPGPEGLRFECTRCGQCCKSRGEYNHLYLDDDELVQLARYLGMLPMEFRQRFTFIDEYGWTQLFLDDRCVFLESKTQRCTVYPVRPTQCRTFPFWRGLVRDGQWSEEARDLCEGIGQGRLYSLEEVSRRMEDMERSTDD